MKKAMKITRLLTALLVLCVLFTCTAGAALADEFQGYVASIGIVAADTEAEAKQQLESTGLRVPQITSIFLELKRLGLPVDTSIHTVDAGFEEITLFKNREPRFVKITGESFE